VRVGTLSKALGSLGGFVAGERRLIDQIIHQAPSFIYSTALPPAAAAAAHEALKIANEEPWRREGCHALADRLRAELRSRGHKVPDSRGPIVPLIQGESETALDLSSRLLDAGLLVPAAHGPCGYVAPSDQRDGRTYGRGRR
jgi:8-amino-7-oxononanoate synthase